MSVLFQIFTFSLSLFESLIRSLSEAINNKWVVGTIVITLGSVYPLILKYTKNGQSKYPFMIGVAVCLKNILMLCYYFGRFLWFLYTEYQHNKEEENETNIFSNISLHTFVKNSSEIETLSGMDPPKNDHNEHALVNNERINIKRKLKLYLYLAPNALLVLVNDILALHTLSFVSVSTYAVFMQVTIIFIVMVRFVFLKKVIKKSQLLSVCISVLGMVIFELVGLDPQMTASQSIKGDLIGIGLCMVRGILKACDLVYVEWFIHSLNEIPFYEKQCVVSLWFVICSFLYVLMYHGHDIFVLNRSLLDGFNATTWIFVSYGTFFALMIYLLILRLDAMKMGFCQQATVIISVSLDVIVFKTKVTPAMWMAALIVVIAIIQYSVIQFEHIVNVESFSPAKAAFAVADDKDETSHR